MNLFLSRSPLIERVSSPAHLPVWLGDQQEGDSPLAVGFHEATFGSTDRPSAFALAGRYGKESVAGSGNHWRSLRRRHVRAKRSSRWPARRSRGTGRSGVARHTRYMLGHGRCPILPWPPAGRDAGGQHRKAGEGRPLRRSIHRAAHLHVVDSSKHSPNSGSRRNACLVNRRRSLHLRFRHDGCAHGC